MKIRRIKSRSKRIASALNYTCLTNEQAVKMYDAFYDLFKMDVEKDLEKVRLTVINGGKKCLGK